MIKRIVIVSVSAILCLGGAVGADEITFSLATNNASICRFILGANDFIADDHVQEARRDLRNGDYDSALASYESFLRTALATPKTAALVAEALSCYDFVSVVDYSKGLAAAWGLDEKRYRAMLGLDRAYGPILQSMSDLDSASIPSSGDLPGWAFNSPELLVFVSQAAERYMTAVKQGRTPDQQAKEYAEWLGQPVLMGEYKGVKALLNGRKEAAAYERAKADYNRTLGGIGQYLGPLAPKSEMEMLSLLFVYARIRAIETALAAPIQREVFIKCVFGEIQDGASWMLARYSKDLKASHAIENFVAARSLVGCGEWATVKKCDHITHIDLLSEIHPGSHRLDGFSINWRDAVENVYVQNKLSREKQRETLIERLAAASTNSQVRTWLSRSASHCRSNRHLTGIMYRYLLFDLPCVVISADTLNSLAELDYWTRTPNDKVAALYVDWANRTMYRNGYVVTDLASKMQDLILGCASGEISEAEMHDAKARIIKSPERWREVEKSIKEDLGD